MRPLGTGVDEMPFVVSTSDCPELCWEACGHAACMIVKGTSGQAACPRPGVGCFP